MGLLSELHNLMNEHGSSTILWERFGLLKDMVVQLEEKNSELKKALADLEIENTKLRKQLKEQTVAEEFTEHRGAFFKRNKSGGYDPTVYCLTCRRPLGSMQGIIPYRCKVCKIALDFNDQDLPRVLDELSKK